MSDTLYVPGTGLPIANNIIANTGTTISSLYPKFNPVGSIDKSKTYLVTFDNNMSINNVTSYLDYLRNEGIDVIAVPKGFQFYEARHIDELKAFLKLWLEEL